MKSNPIAAFGLALVLSVVSLGASAQQSLDTILKEKSIRIGVPADLPPFGFKGADGQLRGLDIDVAQLVAAKLGAKAELVAVASAKRVPWLQERKVDLVISTLGRNPEREKLVLFSNDYSSFYLSVFGPKAVSVAGPAELSKKSIAVTRGSIEDQELTKVAPANATIQRFDDNAATMAAYAAGKTQLLATSVSAVAAAMQQNTALEADSKFVLKESKNHMGIPMAEEPLRNRVNEIIEEARTSGELRKITQKWFSRAAMK